MKSTGIVREVDELGRIVIPKEMRNVFSIDTKDPMEIFTAEVDKKQVIILKKYNPGCEICGNVEGCVSFLDKKVCKNCIKEANVMSTK